MFQPLHHRFRFRYLMSGNTRVQSNTMTSAKKTVSMPEDLESLIDKQVNGGINDSFSEWLQEAAYIRLSMQGLALEAQGRRVTQQGIEDGDIDPDVLEAEL